MFCYLKICSICLIFRYSVPGLPEKECEQDRNENVVHTNFHAVILNLSVDNITWFFVFVKYFLYIDIVSLFTSSKGCRIIFFLLFRMSGDCYSLLNISSKMFLVTCWQFFCWSVSSRAQVSAHRTQSSQLASPRVGRGGAGRGDGGGAGGESLKMLLRGHVTSAPAPSHLASSAANMLQSTHASVQPRHSHCDIIRIVNII